MAYHSSNLASAAALAASLFCDALTSNVPSLTSRPTTCHTQGSIAQITVEHRCSTKMTPLSFEDHEPASATSKTFEAAVPAASLQRSKSSLGSMKDAIARQNTFKVVKKNKKKCGAFWSIAIVVVVVVVTTTAGVAAVFYGRTFTDARSASVGGAAMGQSGKQSLVPPKEAEAEARRRRRLADTSTSPGTLGKCPRDSQVIVEAEATPTSVYDGTTSAPWLSNDRDTSALRALRGFILPPAACCLLPAAMAAMLPHASLLLTQGSADHAIESCLDALTGLAFTDLPSQSSQSSTRLIASCS